VIVCFDIGSTLVDGPNVGPVRRLVEALTLPKEAEIPLTRLLFTTDPGTPEGLAAAIHDYCGADPKSALQVVRELWEAQVEEAYVLPGAAETVERLRSAGLSIAFISNIWAPFYQGFRRCLPELAQTCPAYLSFQRGLAKPNVGLYRYALKDLEVSPSAAVMIGDTYQNDIVPASVLGMKTIWVLHRPDKEKADLVRTLNGEAPRADLTLGQIGDLLPDHIRSLL
jgi:HAD superfamily hydrolase (TIGR01509 family)